MWIARLGGDARFIGKVGADPAAQLLEWDLLKEGVLPETIHAAGSTATLTHILRAGGGAELVADRGVAIQLKPEEVLDAWLEDAEWLHLPAESLWELPLGAAAAKAVRLARDARARLSIDLSSADGMKRYGLPKFRVLLKTLKPDVIFATLEQAALFEAGALGELAAISVLNLGSDGCAVGDSSGYREYAAEKARALDPQGADDAFDAAWCLTYLRTGNIEQACQTANRLRTRVAAHQGLRPKVDLKGVVIR